MENKKIIKYFYETVVSQNVIKEIPKYISEDCVLRIGEKILPLGVNGMKQHLLDIRKTYPDYTIKILHQYSEGDYIISEFIMEGTHKGEFIGIKPTNKRLVFTGVDIDKIKDGKIIEHSGATNTFETFFENNMIKPI
jgi:hypothetical protein